MHTLHTESTQLYTHKIKHTSIIRERMLTERWINSRQRELAHKEAAQRSSMENAKVMLQPWIRGGVAGVMAEATTAPARKIGLLEEVSM